MSTFNNYTKQEIICEYYNAKMRLRNPLINNFIKEKCNEIIRVIEESWYIDFK